MSSEQLDVESGLAVSKAPIIFIYFYGAADIIPQITKLLQSDCIRDPDAVCMCIKSYLINNRSYNVEIGCRIFDSFSK